MTISEIAEELDLSYYYVARTLTKLYWTRPYKTIRCLVAGKHGRKVKYRWSSHS